jgi:hypothetical protein
MTYLQNINYWKVTRNGCLWTFTVLGVQRHRLAANPL